MNDVHIEAYIEEAREHLIQLEEALLELETSPQDTELIGMVFRSMHTIKGSGAMFGFTDIEAFTHEVESVYDLVRDGKMSVTKELIDLSLKARDCIRMMLNDQDTDEALIEYVRSEFKKLNSKDQNAQSKHHAPKEGLEQTKKPETYLIRFYPHADIFESGTNPILLLRELSELGNCDTVAHIETIPPLDVFETEKCYTTWDLVLTTDAGLDAIQDVFIFVSDEAEIQINPLKDEDEGSVQKKIGEILLERGDITTDKLQAALGKQKRIGEVLIEEGSVLPDSVQSALAEQEHSKRNREKQQSEESISSIRVAASKLDILVDLVGELVTMQAHLTQKANSGTDPELLAISEQVERLTAELRDNAMGMRMLPIGTTFGRFKRLVRDLSVSLGKKIDLITEGAETEIDKTVIEKLNDPLVHLIRNSIDHGIEPPEIRKSLNKPETGRIRLSALHSGANVIVQIQDDGKGLDRNAIFEKAVEKGLVSRDAVLTDDEIFGFIFHAGFSTAREVTNVSGRGVGMDVVRKAIVDKLKGSIEISSEQGKGTTVSIKLPLTLAIVEGLLVKIADSSYVLPLSIVKECIELSEEDRRKSQGGNLAYIRGEIVPYLRLRHEFGITGGLPEIEQIVVTESDGNRVGLVVDSVVGEHQTVIKNLGKMYGNVEGISGATVLGDGSVALIVDVRQILRASETVEAARNQL
ncbi:MAG TPA: chemotaxis protein CheA [Syntrophorhabdaceae bacterium]|nr:chemotaxis protein CheA [Syntrophorhabdaceae bacterium]